MAKVIPFKATPKLAAMSQAAAQVLAGKNMAIAPGGMAIQRPTPQPTVYPQSLRDRAPQLTGGGVTRMNANMSAALRINPWQVRAFDAAQAARQAAGEGGDPFSQEDFERGNLHFASQLGLTGEDALRFAQQHAPSYGGVQFSPHNIAQEGDVTYRNGVPGIMVKYSSPGQGSSTEWVPLQ